MPYRFRKSLAFALTARSPHSLNAMYTVNPPVGPAMDNDYQMVGLSRTSGHTVSNLSRWSVQDQPLPKREAIKTIHVYDFDNTLFMSPLPNTKIWASSTLGFLHQPKCFSNGGWWHDPRFLAATGRGLEVEEVLAWEGWWNEPIVDLVELSGKQNDALTILLTGRSAKGYANLIQRMVASKNLEFDIIALRPDTGPGSEHIKSTILFKCMFLEDVLNTYKGVEEIRVYEDRVKHVKSFEEFLAQYSLAYPKAPGEKSLTAEVIQVAEIAKSLSPVAELTVMQKAIDDHNNTLEQSHGAGASPLRINTIFGGKLLRIEENTLEGE